MRGFIMDMKADVNTPHNSNEAIETAGDATIISWSSFASLDELREEPQSAVQAGSVQVALDRAQGKSDNPRSVLDRYREWLRTFNR